MTPTQDELDRRKEGPRPQAEVGSHFKSFRRYLTIFILLLPVIAFILYYIFK